VAKATPALTGLWRLISVMLELKDSGKKQPAGRQNPQGFLAMLPEGRMMVMVGGGKREMFAYSGTYAIEGDRWITEVDVAWEESWVGTRQVRTFAIQDDVLTVTGDWRTSSDGRKARRILEWKRVQ
jgi:hypothetical protein